MPKWNEVQAFEPGALDWLVSNGFTVLQELVECEYPSADANVSHGKVAFLKMAIDFADSSAKSRKFAAPALIVPAKVWLPVLTRYTPYCKSR
jgi:hypothetical protein